MLILRTLHFDHSIRKSLAEKLKEGIFEGGIRQRPLTTKEMLKKIYCWVGAVFARVFFSSR
ncbi:hypothetical protein C7B82_11610 [Stenomitos frigidus ULC18]|uniref:Uncharacterized protein n=1 Tax=Stenomitos frigidus ULC18 TaxID=2107698 RepID=A0A2T1E9M7_9CYAN|nr:hypothetical protein C7B82_11610 [Stenomitos frigidus ULC18]